MRTHFTDGRFWTLITNLILFFDYDVILRLHDAVMTSFFAIFFISRTTCVRIVGITPNDAEYMISLRGRISFRRLSPKKCRFCARSYWIYQQYHIILHYASNFDILVTNVNNPSNSIEKRFRTFQAACMCISACVWGGGEGEHWN